MVKNLSLEIECGEKSCLQKQGPHCKYLGTIKSGSISVCTLFPSKYPTSNEQQSHTVLEEVNGWVQRCKQCIESETILSENSEKLAWRICDLGLPCPRCSEQGREYHLWQDSRQRNRIFCPHCSLTIIISEDT